MSETQKKYTRFGIFERIEHFVLVLSFTTLGLTGIPQKYADSSISQSAIALLGGIEGIRVIHRIAAAIFLLEAIYHIVVVGYKLYVQRKQATMLPGVKDGVDAFQWIRYKLGLGNVHPKMPRYNFMEKAEYWAMLWGLVLMGLTGLMLWNPIATTHFLPGDFIPAAKAAHGGEAVLAVLAIILWHFYHVHIKHWNWAMIRGTLTRHEMEHEHGQELEQIESGKLPQQPAADVVRQRLMLFIPVAAVVSLALAGLTWYFLTFEKTAITTVPPVSDAPVFLQPTATPEPVEPTQPAGEAPADDDDTPAGEAPAGAPTTWDAGFGALFADKCAGCHGTMGGYSVETYDDALKAIQPGDPDASKLVEVQKAGGHPGQFDEAELKSVIDWITAGAPQQ
jgi:cytochrome b subunit of formate dehydrogenase/mono/diheme cytochrome c family protein